MILNGLGQVSRKKKSCWWLLERNIEHWLVKVESPSGREVESRSDKQCGLSAPCFLFLGKHRYTCND